MDPRIGGACQADTRQTPVEHQGTSDQRSPRRFYDTPPTAISPALRTNRRWNRRPRTLRTTAVVTLGLAVLCAAIVGLGIVADHIPSIVFGLGVIAVGAVCGALLAARA